MHAIIAIPLTRLYIQGYSTTHAYRENTLAQYVCPLRYGSSHRLTGRQPFLPEPWPFLQPTASLNHHDPTDHTCLSRKYLEYHTLLLGIWQTIKPSTVIGPWPTPPQGTGNSKSHTQSLNCELDCWTIYWFHLFIPPPNQMYWIWLH